MRRFDDFTPSAAVGGLVLMGSLVAPPPAFGQYQGRNFNGSDDRKTHSHLPLPSAPRRGAITLAGRTFFLQ